MERWAQISEFINSLVTDYRLRSIHIALSTALCHAWIASQFQPPYSVLRSNCFGFIWVVPSGTDLIRKD